MLTDTKKLVFFIKALILSLISFSYGALLIKSNYPLPKNNIQEIYKKTKDINYIIKLLKKTEEFEEIKYKNGILYLKRKPVLKRVHIIGNRSFWRREIIAISGLIEGHPFDMYTVHQIVSRIKRFYGDKGYPFTEVYIDVNVDEIGNADMYIKIKEGKRGVIRNVNFFSDITITTDFEKKLRKLLNIKKGEKFSFIKLQKKIEKLSEHLKEKGFYDNFIIFYSIDKKKEKYIDINLFLSLGFKYYIFFSGNKFFPNEILKKYITFQQGVNYYQITKSIESIINLYKSYGFLDVQVLPDYKEIFTKNKVILTFFIKEGNRYKISDIKVDSDIKGIEKRLNIYKNKPYNRKKILVFLESLFNSYYSKGYLSFSYSINENLDRKNKSVSLYIKVKKGKKYILKKVSMSENRFRLDIKIPSAYNPQLIISYLEKIKNFYKDLGYLDAKVYLNVRFKEGKDTTDVEVLYQIEKGKRYRTGITFIYGTRHIFPKVIKKNIYTEGFFIKEKFDEELDYLYSTYVFDTVNPFLEIDKKNKKVDKIYLFYEDKRGLFQGSVGYNTNQKFKLSLQGTLKNLFNYGFEISSYIETSNLGTTYQISFGNKFVPFRNSVFLNLFRNYQSHRIFDLIEKGGEIIFEKKKDKYRKYSIGLSYKDNRLSKQSIFPENYLSYKISYWYKDIHGIPKVNPKKGYNLKYGVFLNFGDYNLQKLIASYRYFLSWKIFTLTPKVSLGYIVQDIKKIPLPDRFYLGGISNLRGFSYENVSGKSGSGGKAFLLFNNDLRFLLYRRFNLYGFVFYDFGNVYEKMSYIKDLSFRDSLGSGVFVPTPVGSFMFYVAYNLHRKGNEDKYRIEFSISTEF